MSTGSWDLGLQLGAGDWELGLQMGAENWELGPSTRNWGLGHGTGYWHPTHWNQLSSTTGGLAAGPRTWHWHQLEP